MAPLLRPSNLLAALLLLFLVIAAIAKSVIPIPTTRRVNLEEETSFKITAFKPLGRGANSNLCDSEDG